MTVNDPAGELAELQSQVTELGSRLDVAAANGERDEPTPAIAEPGPGAGFLLFVPRLDRYELVEREGSAPSVGSEVEVSELKFFVSKVARSPLPHDRRPCAYLQSLR